MSIFISIFMHSLQPAMSIILAPYLHNVIFAEVYKVNMIITERNWGGGGSSSFLAEAILTFRTFTHY